MLCKMQTRSLVRVGALCCHWLVLHAVISAQTRFEVELGAVASYCLDVHAVSALQTRSPEAAAGLSSHCSAVHSVCDKQTRSDVALGALASYWVALQIVERTHACAPASPCQYCGSWQSVQVALLSWAANFPGTQLSHEIASFSVCASSASRNCPRAHAAHAPATELPHPVWCCPAGQVQSQSTHVV